MECVFFAFLILASAATAGEARLCDRAAEIASADTGVPVQVLKAISRTETGRGAAASPWPWTVNMEGKGKWFDTEDAARSYVFRHFKTGARSFDVGCFQINYKWHGRKFASIDAMFDPVENALYAARFLKDLYRETGTWEAAAGAYHSRTPKYAKKYRARYETIFAKLEATPVAAARAPTKSTENHYPFFASASGARSGGSLVPLGASSARPLIRIGE